MIFEQTERQLTKAEITAFEQQYEIELPETFKQHYLQYNGGYPPYEYLKGADHIFTINGFYPIKYGRLTIEKLISDYQKSGINLTKAIPFAYDNGGNIYLLSVEKSTCGQVFIMEAESEDNKKNLLVAKSFTHFLDSFFE